MNDTVENDRAEYWKGFFNHVGDKKDGIEINIYAPTGVYRTDGVQIDDVEKALEVIELRERLSNIVKLMENLKKHPHSTYEDMEKLDNLAKSIDAKATNIFNSLTTNMQYAVHNFDK